MADTEQAEVVSQDQFTNDLVNEQLIDDEGNPLKTEKEKEPDKEPDKEPEAEGDKAKADAAKLDKKTKEADKKPTGFDARFFKKNEKSGKEEFDPDTALSFFTPKDGDKLRFSGYTPKTVIETKKDGDKTAIDPRDFKALAKRDIEEEKKYRDGVREHLFLFQKRFGEYRAAGHEETASLQATARDIEDYLGGILKEREYETSAQRKEREYKEAQDMKETAQLEQQARSNELVFANTLGGIEQYNSLMFDKNLGGVVMNKLFDLMNPGFKVASQEELQGKMQQWYTRLASDMNNLQYVYEMALARLQMRHWPKIVERVRSAKATGDTKKAQATLKTPDGIVTNSRTPKEPDALDKYLSGNIPEI